jgi:K+-sensing histidine kinase KdpD
VIIETPATAHRSFDAARDLQQAIDDAVDLGADILRIEAADLAAGMVKAARTRRATHVVLPHVGTNRLQRLREAPVVDRLLASLPDLEVHIVGGPAG